MSGLKVDDKVYITSAGRNEHDSYDVAFGKVIIADESQIVVSLLESDIKEAVADDHLCETFSPISNEK